MSQKNIAVVLSGCGVLDGSEIQEAVMAILSINQQGNKCNIFAPDIEQANVVDHITKKKTNEVRNVLVESARIARTDISSLDELKVSEQDALLFPGGYGAILNFLVDNPDSKEQDSKKVIEPLTEKILDFISHKKPICCLCISPVIVAHLLDGLELTLGNDKDTIAQLNSLNVVHKETQEKDKMIIDKKYKIVSAPCYLFSNSSISTVYDAIYDAIKETVKLI